ncbi:MAG: VOC family protein [Dehalococcoidia bacterium]
MLDHVVYAVPALEAAQDDLEARLGVRPSYGGPHPGRGSHNALLDLGRGAYLEVIAPDPSQPDPGRARPFGLDKLTAARLVHWAAKASDLEARVAAAKESGFDPGAVEPLSRSRPDGQLLEWRLTVRRGPPGGDGLVPFLIDWGGAAHPAETAAHGCTIVELHGEHPDPPSIRRLLAALGVDLEVVAAERAALVVTIEGPKGRIELR